MKTVINKKSKLIASLAIASFVFFASCKKENTEPEKAPVESYLIFGEYYGFCVPMPGASCIAMFKWSGDSLIRDLNPSYPSSKKIYVGFSPAKRLSCGDSLVRELIAAIPIELLSEKDTVIGEPDATDGGGLYIELKDESGQRRFYLIDNFKQNIPPYLHPFVDKVHKTIDSLKNCDMWYQCG